ncbi:MAG: helix-turn-helix domain-containing protein [Solirubrobacteraceae bacterium]
MSQASSSAPDRRPDRGVRLLDVDPELGAALEGSELVEARELAVLPTLALAAGAWDVEQLAHAPGVSGEVHGFLVLDGAVTASASIVGRACDRLVFAGGLVLVDGAPEMSIPVQWSWSAVTRTRVAILDDRLVVIGARWPRLLGAILNRAGQQSRQALLYQAISQLPRVEDRLLALMWVIADRCGVVRSDGIHVPLPVTHQALARMIGAQRPTVTLGLGRLAEEGLLRPETGGWVIDPDSAAQFRSPDGAPDPDHQPAAST